VSLLIRLPARAVPRSAPAAPWDDPPSTDRADLTSSNAHRRAVLEPSSREKATAPTF